ncbi:hypothetical protein M2277_003497 [Paenibacillus sp. LBL]|nr:hypothetical protein [Paenibacillus sp. LBL]
MKGHVYPRGETYTYVIDLPPDPMTGSGDKNQKVGLKLKRKPGQRVT